MLITPDQAFAQHLSHIFLTTTGVVSEILPDDTTGVTHQRFLIMTPSKHSLLIVYNLDRGPRIPVQVGNKVTVEGTYVWNKYGGLLHHTHQGVNEPHPDGKIDIVH